MSDVCTYEVVVLVVREKAILVVEQAEYVEPHNEIDGELKYWIPLSQLEDCDAEDVITAESEQGDQGTIAIPEWLAVDKGLE